MKTVSFEVLEAVIAWQLVGPFIGNKYAEANKRNFSAEVIKLPMSRQHGTIPQGNKVRALIHVAMDKNGYYSIGLSFAIKARDKFTPFKRIGRGQTVHLQVKSSDLVINISEFLKSIYDPNKQKLKHWFEKKYKAWETSKIFIAIFMHCGAMTIRYLAEKKRIKIVNWTDIIWTIELPTNWDPTTRQQIMKWAVEDASLACADPNYNTQSMLTKLEHKCEILTRQREEKEDEFIKFKIDHQTLKREMKQLRSKHDDKSKQVARLHQEQVRLQQIERQYEDAVKWIQDNKRKVSKLTKEHSNVLRDYESEIAELQLEAQRQNQRITRYKKLEEEYKRSKTLLRQDLDNARKENAKYVIDITSLKTENKRLVEQQIQNEPSASTKETNPKRSTRRDEQKYQEIISKLKEEQSTLKQQNEKLLRERNDFDEEITSLKEENKQLADEKEQIMEQYSKRFKKLRSKNHQLQRDNKEYAEQIESFQSQIADHANLKKRLNQENASLKEEMKSLREEKEEHSGGISKLEEENKTLMDLLETLESKYQANINPLNAVASAMKFKIRIAIDFGTDGVGFAYATSSENVFVHENWGNGKYGRVTKPKAVALLDEAHKLLSMGMDAKATYSSMPNFKDKWMLFERFKMSLYDDNKQEQRAIDNQHSKQMIRKQLTATNGRKIESSVVFIAVLKNIQKLAKTMMRKKKIKGIKKGDIQWILTVPAIWNDDAKEMMKQWAIESGMVDPKIAGQCRIVYEPDCASLAVQHEILDDEKQDNLKKGEKYILIDAGGGTVDIVCHEVLDGMKVREVCAPSGGPWGSCYIDDQYIELLNGLFSEEWINEFKSSHANVWCTVMDNFQKSKISFKNGKEQSTHNVSLTVDLVGFMQDKLEGNDEDADLEEFVPTQIVFGHKQKIKLSEDVLEIESIIWKEMFDRVIEPTIDHVNGLLSRWEMKQCKYLCLVGGLCASQYVQKQFKFEFQSGSKTKHRLKVIIPNKPLLSVVVGAARMGLRNDYIEEL